MGKDEPMPKLMMNQANSVLSKFKAAESAGGLLNVSTKPVQSVSPSLLKRQQSGDQIRKAFEADLVAGKQKLKKLGNDAKTTNGNGLQNILVNSNLEKVIKLVE